MFGMFGGKCAIFIMNEVQTEKQCSAWQKSGAFFVEKFMKKKKEKETLKQRLDREELEIWRDKSKKNPPRQTSSGVRIY